jgi:hypothetical protein
VFVRCTFVFRVFGRSGSVVERSVSGYVPVDSLLIWKGREGKGGGETVSQLASLLVSRDIAILITLVMMPVGSLSWFSCFFGRRWMDGSWSCQEEKEYCVLV